MASNGASKPSCKHSCNKCVSPGISNISIDGSEASSRTNDINMNTNSYANTPSPTSTESASTINRSYKYRRSSSRNDYSLHMFSKRRHHYDRLFHHTHSLNRQYIITMTNILFNMQREMYKLKRRTHHVEQMLAKHAQAANPVLRIPRLTRDEISTICITDHENQENVTSSASVVDETNPVTVNNTQPPDENERNEVLLPPSDIKEERTPPHQLSIANAKYKYCTTCSHEFSHRSGFLRHVRRLHNGVFPPESDYNNSTDTNNHDLAPTTTSITDPPSISTITDNETENDEFQMLINPWDIGEGRLRPRPVSKLNNEPISKTKCDICNKLFRTDYLKKHKKRTHGIRKTPPSNEINDTSPDQAEINNETTSNETPAINDESPSTRTDPPSAITIAEMDIDDMPIQFRRESIKPIIIAVTCLERFQLKIVEEFVQKFSSRVSQTSTIDSQTTHLITNDDQQILRSPLSIKFVEAIANHCFCVSYRWIVECVKYDRIVDEDQFEIEGDNTDAFPHGGPKRSRLTDKRHSLFDKICFMIKCTENNDIKISNDRLQNLVTTCGGRIINCVTQELLNNFEIYVLCDKLYVSERRHNYDQCRSLGIQFVSSAWVLESIAEYRKKPITPFEEIPS